MNILRAVAGLKQRLLTRSYQKQDNNIFVLMFHEVTQDTSAVYPSTAISTENFVALLDGIAGTDAKFASVDHIHSAKEKTVVITFDDIFENAYRNAIPVLRQRNIPYTVFVSMEYVDKPGFITGDMLRQLKEDPLCTVGFHANSHVMMRTLNDVQITEAVDPGKFQDTYDVDCRYFAFPYGSVYACPKRAVRLAKKQGFAGVFSTINSPVNAAQINKDPWFIPRININDKSWTTVLHKLQGE